MAHPLRSFLEYDVDAHLDAKGVTGSSFLFVQSLLPTGVPAAASLLRMCRRRKQTELGVRPRELRGPLSHVRLPRELSEDLSEERQGRCLSSGLTIRVSRDDNPQLGARSKSWSGIKHGTDELRRISRKGPVSPSERSYVVDFVERGEIAALCRGSFSGPRAAEGYCSTKFVHGEFLGVEELSDWRCQIRILVCIKETSSLAG